MLIIGCDLHTRYQQIAMLDKETGELVERRRCQELLKILDQLEAKLSQLSPLRILERGYAIVMNERGIVKDAASAPPGSAIHVRLATGALDATVQ